MHSKVKLCSQTISTYKSTASSKYTNNKNNTNNNCKWALSKDG